MAGVYCANGRFGLGIVEGQISERHKPYRIEGARKALRTTQAL
jgi:hypothetical protein